jgi:hypothetical protein
MNGKLSLALALAGLLSACGSAAPQSDTSEVGTSALSVPEIVVMPSRGSTRPPRAAPASAAIQPAGTAAVSTGNGINYYGGPIMSGTVNLYYIWYGNWSGSSTPGILNDWGNSLSNSPIYRVNTTYSDNTGATVSGSTRLAGSTSPGYTHGTNLGDGDIWSIVNDALSAGKLPVDSNGVYFVLTSPDINETSGFCTQYCGWHTANYRNNTPIKYSFIGGPSRCNGSCGGGGVTPNGDSNADNMASIMFHELSESVSDPLINAWSGPNGENGDMCAWNFGPTYKVGNGATANVRIGNRYYLLQQMWLNANGGSCRQSGNPIATMYADCNYSGTSWNLAPGDYALWQLQAQGIPDNAVSSLGVISGYQAVFYDQDYAGGFSAAFGTAGCLGGNTAGRTDGSDWNDKLTSLRIQPKVPNGNYLLKNVNSGRCADVYGGSTADNTNIALWDCSNTDGAERWTLTNTGGNAYEIRRAGTDQCLDIYGGSYNNNINIEGWTCNKGSAQQFNLIDLDGGQYELRRAGSSKCVDVYGGYTANNSNIEQWDCNGGPAQRFSLIPD